MLGEHRLVFHVLCAFVLLSASCCSAVSVGGQSTFFAWNGYSEVAVGAQHACAIIDHSCVPSLACFGYNTYGQLGVNRNISYSKLPTFAFGGTVPYDGWTDDATPEKLSNPGAPEWGASWGDASIHRLPSADGGSPTQGGGRITHVSAGGYQTCIQVSGLEWVVDPRPEEDGDDDYGDLVACWGQHSGGLVQDVDSHIPKFVPGLNRVVSIDVGNNHACAVRTDAYVWCWGWNTDGQLGDGGVSGVFSGVPQTLMDNTHLGSPPFDLRLNGIKSVSVGEYHSCAVTHGGSIVCWGSNAYSQLGPSPGTTWGDGYDQVSVAAQHSCASRVINSGGHFEVQCWGSNSAGQITGGAGDDTLYATPFPSEVFPVPASGAENWGKVSAGGTGDSSISCYITRGERKCWGGSGTRAAQVLGSAHPGIWNIGQYEYDTSTYNIVDMDTGSAHSCQIRSTGIIECWGIGPLGTIKDLGDGTPSPVAQPTSINWGSLEPANPKCPDSTYCSPRTKACEFCSEGWEPAHTGKGCVRKRPKQTVIDCHCDDQQDLCASYHLDAHINSATLPNTVRGGGAIIRGVPTTIDLGTIMGPMATMDPLITVLAANGAKWTSFHGAHGVGPAALSPMAPQLMTNLFGNLGYGVNGHGANGFGANGFGANGFGANGFGANGFGANGFGANGYIGGENIPSPLVPVADMPYPVVHADPMIISIQPVGTPIIIEAP